MRESKHRSWLWPDRTIGKQESRSLRDEHNVLINSHAELLEAAQEFVGFYAGNKRARLGNGQASRSYDRFRAAITKATEGGS